MTSQSATFSASDVDALLYSRAMNTDPMSFFREDYPQLFNRGVAELGERDDEKAKSRHADIVAARGAVHILLDGEGGGSVWLATENGAMSVHESAPDGFPVRFAIGAPIEAARTLLEELESADLFDEERASRRIARIASAEVEGMLEGHALEFHITLSDIPADPDEVTVRVALGGAEPPAEPKFSATVSWDDIEDVRDGELTPQQLFGRLKITGDASQAMALGMTLMQRRPRT